MQAADQKLDYYLEWPYMGMDWKLQNKREVLFLFNEGFLLKFSNFKN